MRQMLKKIRVEDNGDTEFLPGTLVDVLDFEEKNQELIAEGKEPAEGKTGNAWVLQKLLWQPIPSCLLLPSRRLQRFLQRQLSKARSTH